MVERPGPQLVGEQIGQALVCHVKADEISTLDAIDTLMGQFKNLIDTHKPGVVVIDFTGVRFLATAAINVLLVVQRRVRSAGGQVCLSGLDTRVREVFEQMLLDKIFPIYSTKEQALQALAR